MPLGHGVPRGPVLVKLSGWSRGCPVLGREVERKALGRLLEEVRSGHSGVLVVHGELGVGKTALLERAVEAAPDFRRARTLGIDEEMDRETVTLHHHQGYTVSKGVVHRTRAPGRASILMIEAASVTPTGD
jgi:predicted ATPase